MSGITHIYELINLKFIIKFIFLFRCASWQEEERKTSCVACVKKCPKKMPNFEEPS